MGGAMADVKGIEKLKLLDQEHLLEGLNQAEIQHLLKQTDSISVPVFKLQQQVLHEEPQPTYFKPFLNAGTVGDPQLGEKLIAEGKVGCIILAGGEGTRLGFDGPKGSFLIPGVQKTLFQIHAEQIRGPTAVMTSPKNDEETRKYWKDHNNFGVKDLSFFQQSQLPLLDKAGCLFLEDQETLAIGPDGNGSVFQNFAKSGILSQWEKQGVEIIQIILIDNALATPFDAEFIGYHQNTNADITLKCTPRLDANEKVGVLVEADGAVRVLEYTELGDHKEGDYLANLSLMCLSISFFKDLTKQQLPLHKALKKYSFWDALHKKQISPSAPNVWKFEYFSFDVLPYASKVEALVCPREKCFAPLKNASGADSPETVSRALQKQLK